MLEWLEWREKVGRPLNPYKIVFEKYYKAKQHLLEFEELLVIKN